ncbi:MAG TPA: MoxR family ATPase [Acidimicrobiia bacterium]|jgi:MoxR-like ATPase|nr:MoxR family ATPase [Acidimicrobiia bacterium]
MTSLEHTDLDHYADTAASIEAAVGVRIAGQPDLIRQTLVGLLAEGHVLLEGVPGLGKTELVKAFSAAIDVDFARVQFTPDLMPADIVGTQVLEEAEGGHRRFVYQPGPVFTNLLLADEINRATPKTQAALLEAMQERHVTVAGETRPLPRPFLVLATQNPIELEGTYPLPEAQLDRFLFKVTVSPPGADVLEEILRRTTGGALPDVPRAADLGTIVSMIAMTPKLPVATHLLRYVSEIVEATHPEGDTATPPVKRYVRWGASPRGAQAIVLAAKALAMIEGRPHVTAEDIRWAAPAALRHRLVLGYEATAEGVRADAIIDEVLHTVTEPKAGIRGAP